VQGTFGALAEVPVSGQVSSYGGKTFSVWASAALVIVSGVASVAAAIVLPARYHEPTASTGQQTAGIPVAAVSLMKLSPVPAGRAPGFTLTDQDGHVLSLSGFRGKVVVLEFMDSRCTGICPLVSREFIDAYHDLGRTQGRVVFLAVNVNQQYNRAEDVLAYSRAHALTAIPDWYFLTGPAAALRAVWREYDIAVTVAGEGSALMHATPVFFIGPGGNEHYVAEPAADRTSGGTVYLPSGQISGWGQGIAQVAEAMLR
jgi:cytochrome oxidase Cu insertion factor (SCO1/SenC/PrrC family)